MQAIASIISILCIIALEVWGATELFYVIGFWSAPIDILLVLLSVQALPWVYLVVHDPSGMASCLETSAIE